jgi:hypothetical protein
LIATFRSRSIGGIPGALVVELSTYPPDRGIPEDPVETTFTPPAVPGHVLGRLLLDRDNLVAGGQRTGGLVDLIRPDRGHLRMNAPDPGLGTLATVRGLR